MSRTLRWILGILAVLVVLAVIAAGIWFMQNRSQMMAYRQPATQPNAQATPGVPGTTPGQGQPRGPKGFDDDRRFPFGGLDGRGPMMRQRPFMRGGPFMPFRMGFFFLGGLFRLIIPLAVLALVASFFYQLGRRAASSSTPAPAARRDVSLPDAPDSSKSD